MLKIIGYLFFGVGVVLALYCGLWLCFIGGIMGIATAIEAHNVVATVIAWNAIKILLSGFVGYISFAIPSNS